MIIEDEIIDLAKKSVSAAFEHYAKVDKSNKSEINYYETFNNELEYTGHFGLGDFFNKAYRFAPDEVDMLDQEDYNIIFSRVVKEYLENDVDFIAECLQFYRGI